MEIKVINLWGRRCEMKRSLEEWIKIYEKKTGVEFKADPRAKLQYDAEKGFAEYGTTESMVVIGQLCGDAKYWKKFGEMLAIQLGLKHLGTWCIRKIEPYIKFFNVEVDEIEEAGEGLKRYHGHFKDTGKKALFSPRSRNAAGNVVYMVTWEI